MNRLVAVLLLSTVAGLSLSLGPVQAEEPTPIKVRFYRSLSPDVTDKQLLSVIKPFAEMLTDKAAYPNLLDIEKSGTAKELLALGAKLNEGSVHLGVAWGIEYGWLVHKYPELEPMVTVSSGERAPWFSQIMVARQSPITSLAQLKGKRLARFTHASLMDRIVLDALLRKQGFEARDFFVELDKPYTDAKSAIRAVRTGEADCVVVEHTTFSRLEAAQPTLAKAMRILKESDVYPAPVIFGRPDVVDRLRPGLWRQFQAEICKIHESAEGQQLLITLRFETMSKPDKDFAQNAKKAASEYPIERLINLK